MTQGEAQGVGVGVQGRVNRTRWGRLLPVLQSWSHCGSFNPTQTPRAQVLDLVFLAPDAGRHDLVLHIMSSTWVGADLAMPLKLKVAPLTR